MTSAAIPAHTPSTVLKLLCILDLLLGLSCSERLEDGLHFRVARRAGVELGGFANESLGAHRNHRPGLRGLTRSAQIHDPRAFIGPRINDRNDSRSIESH